MRQARALIGASGFVGGNLLARRDFTHAYTSTTIAGMRGQVFDSVVCAAPQAKKWWANQNPEADWLQLQRLMEVLTQVRSRHFVLISTVDVYACKAGIYDDDQRFETSEPYGCHRRLLETFVQQTFDHTQIVRLPALFGPGLKKNVVFDLMHQNQLEKINPHSRFQWYDLTRLADDIERMDAAGIRCMTFATEPIDCASLVAEFFPDHVIGGQCGPAAAYDIRSRYAGVLGGNDGYLLSRDSVMSDLASFIAGQTCET